MNLAELIAARMPKRMPRTVRHEESQLQMHCVDWFAWQYPQLRLNLVASLNGVQLSKTQAGMAKAMGMVAGVADLTLYREGILFGRFCGCLHIEMKTATGRQSPEQKEWQQHMEAAGYGYVVCRSLEEFQRVVKEYLKGEKVKR